MRRQGGKEEGTGDNSQTGGLEREQRSSQSSLPTFPFLRHPGPDPLRIVFRCVPFLPPALRSSPLLALLLLFSASARPLPFEPSLISQLQLLATVLRSARVLDVVPIPFVTRTSNAIAPTLKTRGKERKGASWNRQSGSPLRRVLCWLQPVLLCLSFLLQSDRHSQTSLSYVVPLLWFGSGFAQASVASSTSSSCCF